MLNANLHLACHVVPFVEKTAEGTKLGCFLCLWTHTEAMHAFHRHGRRLSPGLMGSHPHTSWLPSTLESNCITGSSLAPIKKERVILQWLMVFVIFYFLSYRVDFQRLKQKSMMFMTVDRWFFSSLKQGIILLHKIWMFPYVCLLKSPFLQY